MRRLTDFEELGVGDLVRCRPSGLCYYVVAMVDERPILVAAIVPPPESEPQWDVIGTPDRTKRDEEPPAASDRGVLKL